MPLADQNPRVRNYSGCSKVSAEQNFGAGGVHNPSVQQRKPNPQVLWRSPGVNYDEIEEDCLQLYALCHRTRIIQLWGWVLMKRDILNLENLSWRSLQQLRVEQTLALASWRVE